MEVRIRVCYRVRITEYVKLKRQNTETVKIATENKYYQRKWRCPRKISTLHSENNSFVDEKASQPPGNIPKSFKKNKNKKNHSYNIMINTKIPN